MLNIKKESNSKQFVQISSFKEKLFQGKNYPSISLYVSQAPSAKILWKDLAKWLSFKVQNIY